MPAIVALFSQDARVVVVVVVDADREDRRGARTEARAKGANSLIAGGSAFAIAGGIALAIASSCVRTNASAASAASRARASAVCRKG